MQLKEIKELIVLLNSGVHLGVQILADGKVSITDIPLVMDFISKFVPGLQGIDQIPQELSQMTNQDVDDLMSFAIQDLSLPEGKAKEIIETCLKILSDIYLLVKAVKK